MEGMIRLRKMNLFGNFSIIRIMSSMLRRYSGLLFVLIMMILAVPLLWKMWMIRPLYRQSGVRVRTEEIVKDIIDREGWIASDIDIRAVTADHVTFIHRAHIRGDDPETCFSLDFATATLTSCAK